MEIATQLAQIFQKFSESYGDLTMFVEDSQKGIQELLTTHEKFQRRLLTPEGKRRRSSGAARKKNTVEVTLSMKEFGILRKVLNWRTERIGKYPGLLLNMAFIYLVAIFDAFLSDTFTAVLVSRPEMLRSKKQLSYETVISLSAPGDLLRHMANREVNEIGYKSTAEQWNYYRDRFGVEIEQSGVDLDKIVEMSAERNIFVHNNGIVNDIYLQSVSVPKFKRGDQIEMTLARWQEFSAAVSRLAAFVRDSLSKKFGEQLNVGDDS